MGVGGMSAEEGDEEEEDEEKKQTMRDIERLTPITQAERDWTAGQLGSADPASWPPLARRRHVRSLDRSLWAAELARLEPAGPPAGAAAGAPRGGHACDGCRSAHEGAYCDVDPEIGVGCSRCRQRRRRHCVCDGRVMVDRPAPERNFRLKCRNCQQSGEDCEWFAAPINLHSACGNCTRKGLQCSPQEEGLPEMRPLPPQQSTSAGSPS